MDVRITKMPHVHSDKNNHKKVCPFCGKRSSCGIERTVLGGFFKPTKIFSVCFCTECNAEWEFKKREEHVRDSL